MREVTLEIRSERKKEVEVIRWGISIERDERETRL